ncbi:fumarylacetoacetate hydrolase family protein [Clostridium sp. AM58-1XD]|uniref:fumarylacetoacetate hydrolase family protein n=1 Tax=Clostridium sp. AM58-1XD TaxID=2292307 RepID=UPI000E515028|nr:fumarylacetoacetate hydrolase family protein [Clostridium sp. AM58-1XD]RGY99309.1 FAA hydrolase family protein [Clostridium sp. AM58-1XD]
MKLLTYEIEHKSLLGVLSGDEQWVYPLKSMGIDFKDMQELVLEMGDSEKQLIDYTLTKNEAEPYSIPGAVRLEEVKILAPILCPRQDVICLGINYMAHAEESARYKLETFDGQREYPVYFSKRVNRAVSYGENIPSHSDITDRLDYEVELAVIIGKEAKNVSAEEAEEYVFGYTILNDVSARDIQNRHKQWYFGKSLDGSTPMGPWIVTRESLPYPPKLSIQSRINGELRQDSNTELLIFGVSHVISDLSKGMTLLPGTIIAMGTPSGVGMGFQPPKFLKPGDEIECTIEGIGSLVNTVSEN